MSFRTLPVERRLVLSVDVRPEHQEPLPRVFAMRLLAFGRRAGRGAGGRGYRVAIAGRLASRTSALKAATSVSMSVSSLASSRRATSARCS
jgi:hypothetical protein